MKTKIKKSVKINFSRYLFFIVIILFGIIATVYLTQQPQNLQKKAAESTNPSNITSANITDRAFTILWTTSKPTTGMITITQENGKSVTAYDIRNKKKKQLQKFNVHLIQVKGLKPDTDYTVSILQDDSTNQNSFTVRTGKRIKRLNPSHVIDLPIPDYNKKSDELALLVTASNGSNQSNPIAVMVKNKQVFFDLGNLRSSDLSNTFQITKNTKIILRFVTAEATWSKETSITTKVNTLRPIYLHGTPRKDNRKNQKNKN